MTFAAVAVGVVAAGASAYSASQQSDAAGNALSAQNGMYDQAKQAITNATSAATGYLQPYADAGKTDLASLQAGLADGSLNAPMTDAQYQASPLYTPMVSSLADLQATPGYQFQLDQGLQGVNNSASAKGSLLSGATLKATNDYAQGQAATGYQAAWQRAQTAYQQAFNNNQSTQNQKFNQLQSVANNGQAAATNQGNYQMSGADALAGVSSNFGNNAANLALAQGQIGANATTGISNALTSAAGNYLTNNSGTTAAATTATTPSYASGMQSFNNTGGSLNQWLGGSYDPVTGSFT